MLEPGTFNIVYAGVMYVERKLTTLVEAMANVAARKAASGIRLAVHFFGSIRRDYRKKFETLGLTHLVREHEPVEHSRILGFMKAADALYLPSGNDHSYAYTYKTFDYLSVRRPILAVYPAGSAVAGLLGDIDCGELATEDEPGAIADALERMMSRAGKYVYVGRERFIREALADRYESVLNEVIGFRRSSPGG